MPPASASAPLPGPGPRLPAAGGAGLPGLPEPPEPLEPESGPGPGPLRAGGSGPAVLRAERNRPPAPHGPVQTSTSHPSQPRHPVQPSAPSSDQRLARTAPQHSPRSAQCPQSRLVLSMGTTPRSTDSQIIPVLHVPTTSTFQLGPAPPVQPSAPSSAHCPQFSPAPRPLATAPALQPSCRGCRRPGLPIDISSRQPLWVIRSLSASWVINISRTLLKAVGKQQ